METLEKKGMLKNLGKWLNQPFELLNTKAQKWLLIISSGIFVIIFMNIYLPFDIHNWYKNSPTPIFITLSGFGIIGMVFLAFSQFILRSLLPISSFTNLSFIIWFLLEISFLSLVMLIIYGDLDSTLAGFTSDFFLTFRYTFLIIIIPYLLILFYIKSQKSSSQAGVTGKSFNVNNSQLIHFYDENQALKFSVDQNNLLYIKSADNYVAIHYLKNEKIQKELVRTNLKKLTGELADTSIVRIHRSTMINSKKILTTKKTSKGFLLTIKYLPEENFLVSKNFQEEIKTLS